MMNVHSSLTKATLLLTSTLTVMAGAALAPALPQIALAFSSTSEAEFWTKIMMSVPCLFIALGAIFVGMILDKFGRKKMLVGSLLLYGIAGTSGFFATSLFQLILGRAILGIAVAGTMTTVVTLISDYYIGKERHHIIGLQAGSMAFSAFVFLFPGGFLADIHWRAPFLLFALAFLVLPMALVSIPEPELASNSTQETGRVTSRNVVMIILGTGFAGMIVFYMIPTQAPFLLQLLGVEKGVVIGLTIGVAAVVTAVTSVTYRRFREHLSHPVLQSIAFALIGTGYIVVANAADYIVAVAGLCITGLGVGFFHPNTQVWLVSLVHESVRGRYIGMLTAMLFLGQFISPLIIEPLQSAAGLSTAFLVMGIVSLCIGIVTLAGFRQPQYVRRPSPTSSPHS